MEIVKPRRFLRTGDNMKLSTNNVTKNKIEIELSRMDVQHPYFEPPEEVYAFMFKDMEEAARRQCYNAIAHHMFPFKRIKEGWLFTRSDFQESTTVVIVTNDGRSEYLKDRQ